jgi:hypothetical protein
MDQLSAIFSQLMAGLFAERMLSLFFTATGVAVFTYGILELPMHVINKPKKMELKYTSKDIAALLVVLSVAIPIVVLGAHVYATSGASHIKFSFQLFGLCVALAALLGLIFSANLRRFLDDKEKADNKGQWILFVAAFGIVGENIADWTIRIIGNIGANIWYIVTTLVHKQMIVRYAPTAMMINIAVMIALVSVMGNTQHSASANLIGHMIAGIVHWLANRKHIEKLKLQFSKE